MIGIDWGTSSLRAFRIGADGAVLARVAVPRGILTVPPGGFADVLGGVVGPWLASGETRVLVCGMAGSRQGWVEAPYLSCPAGAAELAAALTPAPFAGAQVRLVPGLSATDEQGVPEVMRGEETQLIGALPALGRDALACLPGSHAKWVRIADGRVAAFATCMGGEAFAALRSGTILGRLMQDGPHDPAGFAAGLDRAGQAGHLLHHLFGVRTLGLTGALPPAAAASYLSGLLIGHEVRAMLPQGAHVHLIGEAALCLLYAQAITGCGGTAALLPEDAAAAGLFAIGEHAAWT